VSVLVTLGVLAVNSGAVRDLVGVVREVSSVGRVSERDIKGVDAGPDFRYNVCPHGVGALPHGCLHGDQAIVADLSNILGKELADDCVAAREEPLVAGTVQKVGRMSSRCSGAGAAHPSSRQLVRGGWAEEPATDGIYEELTRHPEAMRQPTSP
jgi:hypothetical protein